MTPETTTSQTPAPRSVLYRGGVIHSAADPFAEAVVVTDGTISWMGSEDTVGTLGDVDDVVALDGALVAPGFVDARLVATREWRAQVRDRLAHGVVSVHLVVPIDDEVLVTDVLADASGGSAPTGGSRGEGLEAGEDGQSPAVPDPAVPDSAGPDSAAPDPAMPDLRVVLQVPPTLAARDAAGSEDVGGVAGLGERLARLRVTDRAGSVVGVAVAATHPDLPDVVRLCTEARLPVRVLVEDDATVGPTVELLRAVGAPRGSRLELAVPVADRWAQQVADAGLAVTVLGSVPAPLAALSSAGVPLAFGSHPAEPAASPWAAVRTAVQNPDPAQRVSARAAFRAHTRGGWRAVDADGAGAGEIRLGAPAHLVAWDADVLSVQAPDGRLAAWSTDPRAGTPLLPELDETHVLPDCRWVLVGGRHAASRGHREG